MHHILEFPTPNIIKINPKVVFKVLALSNDWQPRLLKSSHFTHQTYSSTSLKKFIMKFSFLPNKPHIVNHTINSNLPLEQLFKNIIYKVTNVHKQTTNIHCNIASNYITTLCNISNERIQISLSWCPILETFTPWNITLDSCLIFCNINDYINLCK